MTTTQRPITPSPDSNAAPHGPADLAASEERFRIASSCATDVIYEWDIATGSLRWFGDIDAHLGYAPGEFPRTLEAWEAALHPDDRAAVAAALRRHTESGEPYRDEYRVVRRDGACRHWADRGAFARDAAGRVSKLIGTVTDVTERRLAEQERRANERRLRRRNAALTALARREGRGQQGLGPAFAAITEMAARTLDVERCSVWLLSGDRSEIVCFDLYERTARRHSAGARLGARQFPVYFAALEQDRAIAAHDAHADPRTSEFSAAYLAPLGISSMLDSPVRVGGRCVGVVCHEHVGPPRRWTMEEQHFADCMTNLVSVAIEADQRRRAEEAWREEARVNETLHRIGSQLAAELDLRRLVQMVTDETTALTRAKFGAFFYSNVDDRGQPRAVYALSGAPMEAFAKFPSPGDSPVFAPTFRDGRVVRLADVTLDPRYGRGAYGGMPAGHLPVKSYLAVPVTSRTGGVIGALIFGHPEPGVFSERDERLAVGVAAQAAIAVDNARLYEQTRLAAERLRLLASLVENSGDAIIGEAADGTVLTWNAGAERIFGYRADEVQGKCIALLAPPDRADEFPALLARILRGECIEQFETVRLAKGGRPVEVSLSLSPIKDSDGRVTGISAIARDVGQRRRVEALERERAALKDAVSAMEQVLGVVGHELRTPLAGLRAMSEFLLTDGAREAQEWETFLRAIKDEVVRMAGTVNDMLEAARLNSGRARWNWSAFSLQRACEDATDSIRPLVDHPRVVLSCAVEPEHLKMRGDADAVRRLVLNLLSNACKHTERGTIHVGVRLVAGTEGGGPWVELSVSDTGTGIPPEIVERLGEAFALNAGIVGAHHVSGTGLGLAICRGIVTAHGGTLHVSSAVGAGTTVTARLRPDLPGPAGDDGKARFRPEFTLPALSLATTSAVDTDPHPA